MIVTLVILLVLGLGLFLIWRLLGRVVQSPIIEVIGVVLLLIWMLAAAHQFGMVLP